MATAQGPAKKARIAESRFLIPGVTWDQYLALLDWLGDRQIRVAFDGSTIELMSPSHEHDSERTILGRMIEMLSFELDLDIKCGGSTTFKWPELEKGIEPDECYWFANEPLVRGKRELENGVDPPPDLVVEVEISRSLLDRLGILAALRVPEIWRFREDELEILILGDDSTYRPAETSRCLPTLPVAELGRWVDLAFEAVERRMMRDFVAWVREVVLPRAGG